MYYNLPLIMVRCAILTILFESIFAIILGIRKKKDIINIVLANIITNPVVVSCTFACNLYFGLNARNIITLILETATVCIEGLIYYKYLDYKKINPFALALILNLISYIFGEIYNYIFY